MKLPGDVRQPASSSAARDWLAAIEPLRAGLEFAALGASMGPLMFAPRGNGHTVLVLPAYNAGDATTAPIRHYLNWLGYRALAWELGVNRGVGDNLGKLFERVHDVLDALPETETITLLGWSLGGSMALGVSYALPKRIKRVITLGSPQLPAQDLAAPLLRAGYRMMHPNRVRMNDVLSDWAWPHRAPPHTAIFSRSDGVVPWQLAGTTSHESIEVLGSHMGLGVNPAVFYAVADRLHVKDDQPFKAPAVLAGLFPNGSKNSKNSKG